jgi:hypothetical protein
MRLFVLMLASFLPASAWANVSNLVTQVMASEEALATVPFAEVVHAATGRRVIPLNRTNAVDRELTGKIAQAMDRVLAKLNETNGPAQQKRRINEVSSLFEAALKTELNAVSGFECDFPRTAAGTRQRSGYPDLRLHDKASGRVVYLDPKLFAQGSRNSSLRTFYYEPKRDTNKILEDAHHLIVGFEHDAKATGMWTFLSWELIDLAEFRVRLKAEFQASNRDLYRANATVARSPSTNAVPNLR